MIHRHFRNTLKYIQMKKATSPAETWAAVDIIGSALKFGLAQ